MIRKSLLSILSCLTIFSSLNMINIGIGKIAANIPTCRNQNQEGSFESVQYKCSEGKPEMAGCHVKCKKKAIVDKETVKYLHKHSLGKDKTIEDFCKNTLRKFTCDKLQRKLKVSNRKLKQRN